MHCDECGESAISACEEIRKLVDVAEGEIATLDDAISLLIRIERIASNAIHEPSVFDTNGG